MPFMVLASVFIAIATSFGIHVLFLSPWKRDPWGLCFALYFVLVPLYWATKQGPFELVNCIGPAILTVGLSLPRPRKGDGTLGRATTSVSLLAIFSLVAMTCLVGYFLGYGFEGAEGIRRLSWPLDNPQQIYPLLVVGTAFSAWAFFRDSYVKLKPLAIICFCMGLLASSLTFSKAGQLGLVGALIPLCLSRYFRGKTAYLILAGSIIFTTCFISIRINKNLGLTTMKKSDFSRLNSYVPELKAGISHPFFGLGPSGATIQIAKIEPSSTSNSISKNLYIGAFTTFGIVGIGLLIALGYRIRKGIEGETVPLYWALILFLMVAGSGNSLLASGDFPLAAASCWFGFAIVGFV